MANNYNHDHNNDNHNYNNDIRHNHPGNDNNDINLINYGNVINDNPNNNYVTSNNPAVVCGENGHVAHSTAMTVRERIVQFNFQLVRTTTTKQMVQLEITLTSILETLYQLYVLPLPNPPTELVTKIYKNTMDNIFTLYKLIGYTRDIIDGKGEYTLTYMMIYVWNKFWPELAKQALYFCVHSSPTSSNSLHPYGSWKDIKYFCNYLKHNKGHDIRKSALISYAINLLNTQLYADHKAIHGSGSGSVSMAAKWAPREKSARFGWLFTELARAFYCIYECTANTTSSKERAIIKSKTDYRKLLASLNKHIDTVQIHQCANDWASINPHSQTSITLHKQKYAFLNINKNSSVDCNVRYPDREDRVICSQKFETYLNNSAHSIKGSRVGLHHFIKDAINYIDYDRNDPIIKTVINSQWHNSASHTSPLQNMIAMVDVSGSMDGDPLHCAIGLGIRVAEKSILGPRILTFSYKPHWINLGNCIHADGNTDLIECVKTVQTADWGMNTNFYAALSLILDRIVAMKMPAINVKELVLAIFSDMQIDSGDASYCAPMMEQIREKYAEAGIRCCGEPYDPPHILFWNLRSTNNFPTLTNQVGASMMSGFNPALLNAFCQDGMQSLHSCTPYNILQLQLENPRYNPLENACSQFFHNNERPFIPGIGW
jgi:hypothetical protein